MPVPRADIHVDRDVIRTLLDEQYPEFADLALRHEADGFDNSVWRLGDGLAVRLPRRLLAVPLLEREIRWLPRLAAALPLAVPAPVRVGAPTAGFPHPWCVTRWFEGELAARAHLRSPEQTAHRMGTFLRALHRPAPPDAPGNGLRGSPLATRDEAFESRIVVLRDQVDEDGVRRVWDAALSAPVWRGRPQWIHGDLHPFNLIVSSGDLSAVVDFGDLCAGDPATDLACGWMLLPEASIEPLFVSYGRASDDLVTRALGWTVLFGLMFLEVGVDGQRDYRAVGLRTIDTALSFAGRRI